MILDNLSNAANYFNLHPLLEKAFEFVKQIDLKSIETGSIEIEGAHLKASIVDATLRVTEKAVLETHKKFIDIQIPISKAETYGWRTASTLTTPQKEYDADNDFTLYDDKPSTFVTLQPGEFVIFSPEDAHAPLIGNGEIRKLIIKVAII